MNSNDNLETLIIEGNVVHNDANLGLKIDNFIKDNTNLSLFMNISRLEIISKIEIIVYNNLHNLDIELTKFILFVLEEFYEEKIDLIGFYKHILIENTW